MEIGLEDLKAKKEKYITRIFWLGVEIAFIFGVPAALAVYFGSKIDRMYGEEQKFTLGFLLAAFVLSWVLVILKYRKIAKKIREIDLKIKNYKTDNKTETQ